MNDKGKESGQGKENKDRRSKTLAVALVIAAVTAAIGIGGWAYVVFSHTASQTTARVTFVTFGSTFTGFIGNTLYQNAERISVGPSSGLVEHYGTQESRSYHWSCPQGSNFNVEVNKPDEGLLRVEVYLSDREWGWAAMQHPGSLTLLVVC